MNTIELIDIGLNTESTQESVEVLKKALSDNEYKQTTQAALMFLQEDAVIENLPLDCRMFWGKVALELN